MTSFAQISYMRKNPDLPKLVMECFDDSLCNIVQVFSSETTGLKTIQFTAEYIVSLEQRPTFL